MENGWGGEVPVNAGLESQRQEHLVHLGGTFAPGNLLLAQQETIRQVVFIKEKCDQRGASPRKGRGSEAGVRWCWALRNT